MSFLKIFLAAFDYLEGIYSFKLRFARDFVHVTAIFGFSLAPGTLPNPCSRKRGRLVVNYVKELGVAVVMGREVHGQLISLWDVNSITYYTECL